VKRLNQKLAPFVVLLGTEMDILLDGQLDFSDDVLSGLDYVSASIHTGFRQSHDVMTARLLRAVSNPLVNTLNHPHGRKIGRREGYAVDMQSVVEQAAAIVVLKGDDTLIADPDGRVAVSPGGSPALATAGTGDALTGVVAALLAQGLEAFGAAAAGVWLHVAAGREAARREGAAEGVIAGDVIAALPAARTGAGA